MATKGTEENIFLIIISHPIKELRMLSKVFPAYLQPKVFFFVLNLYFLILYCQKTVFKFPLWLP